MVANTVLPTGKNLRAGVTMRRLTHYCNDFLFGFINGSHSINERVHSCAL